MKQKLRRRNSAFILLAILLPFRSSAAEPETETIRATIFYQPVFSLVSVTPAEQSPIEYQANGAHYVGLGLRYKDFDLGFTVPVPIYSNDTASRGNTSQQVISVGKAWDFHRLDFYFGQYSGFAGRQDAAASFQQRSDLSLDEAALKYSYSVWSNKFSFRRFEDFRKGDSYSAQSINIVGEYHQAFLRGTTPIGSLTTSAGNDQLVGVRTNSLGAGIGYSLIQALDNSRWYLDMSLALGPSREQLLNTNGGDLQLALVGFLNIKGAYSYAFSWVNAGLSLDYGSMMVKAGSDGVWSHVFLPELYLQRWF